MQRARQAPAGVGLVEQRGEDLGDLGERIDVAGAEGARRLEHAGGATLREDRHRGVAVADDRLALGEAAARRPFVGGDGLRRLSCDGDEHARVVGVAQQQPGVLGAHQPRGVCEQRARCRRDARLQQCGRRGHRLRSSPRARLVKNHNRVR